jgi:lysophospholipase L1-like esterase
MSRRSRTAFATSLVVMLTALSAPAAFAANPIQLSLGDSWGFGVGAAVPAEGGYVPRLNEQLKAGFDCSPSPNPKDKGCKRLGLVNLSVGGATTPTLIADQLPTATSILQQRNGNSNPVDNVEVVTVSIGGNDVTNPIIGACLGGITLPCLGVISSEFAAYQADLTQALSALRTAAGPDARIVIGTYDNGIANCFLGAVPGATLLAALVLEGGGPGPLANGIHDIMRSVGAAYDVEVAESYGDLVSSDWVGGADCLHPNDAGYTKVAQSFADVLIP